MDTTTATRTKNPAIFYVEIDGAPKPQDLRTRYMLVGDKELPAWTKRQCRIAYDEAEERDEVAFGDEVEILLDLTPTPIYDEENPPEETIVVGYYSPSTGIRRVK